jgi:hypothetical protein
MARMTHPVVTKDQPITHGNPPENTSAAGPSTKRSLRERVELAGDPTCPPELQLALARDTVMVVAPLLRNPTITAEAAAAAVDTLDAAAGGGLHDLCLMVAAGDRRTPETVLRLLAAKYPAQVAINRNCTGALLSEISRGRDWSARSMAARHKALPHEDLLRLVNDPHRTVALDARNSAARRGGEVAREALLLVRAAPRRRMISMMPGRAHETLSRDPEPRVRSALAAVTDDAAMLTRLAADPHGGVRRAASSRLMGLLQTGP